MCGFNCQLFVLTMSCYATELWQWLSLLDYAADIIPGSVFNTAFSFAYCSWSCGDVMYLPCSHSKGLEIGFWYSSVNRSRLTHRDDRTRLGEQNEHYLVFTSVPTLNWLTMMTGQGWENKMNIIWCLPQCQHWTDWISVALSFCVTSDYSSSWELEESIKLNIGREL